MHAADRRRPHSRGRIAAMRSIFDGLTARRPAIVWSLALLFVFKGFVGLLAAVYPLSPSEPAAMVGAVGLLGVIIGGAIWLVGWRIPPLGFELIASAGSILASWMVAHAATHGGMMVAAFAYPWIAIYSAHFFPRRGVIAQGALMSVGFSVGLVVSGLSDIVVYWTIVVATIWSICIVLGNLSESMRLQAGTDHLTGLLNRGGFQMAALRERALADRTGSPLTLAVLDLDGFKQINDREGHAAGDRLLASLGRSWRARVRPGDILARHGGDEFVLLLPATTAIGAEAVLERLRAGDDPVGWSVGVSEWRSGESLDAPLARADRYLYGVKSTRREEATTTASSSGDDYVAGALLSSLSST